MALAEEREELVRLVTYLMSGLSSWPNHEGFDRDLAPVEVLDAALA